MTAGIRWGLLIAVCFWLFASQPTQAFDLDGFFSGMTRAEAAQKLSALGLVSKPIDSANVEAGPYTISYCDDRLMMVNKQVGFREFNAILVSMLKTHGEPKVDLPAMEADILFLDWKTNDGEYRLNSGMRISDGKRFHNFGELDNSVCKK